MQSLEIEEPPAAHAHGGADDAHTAVDVGGDGEVRGPTAHLQQEGYSQRDRSRQEKAGLLNGAPLSDGSHADGGSESPRPHQAVVAAATKLVANMPGAEPPKDFEHPMSPSERYYAVALFCVVAALLYADQNLMAPNLTQIAEDFGFNEVEKDQYLGGWIGAAFFLVGAPAAILMGYVGGSHNRCTLFFWVVILGELPCILTIFVRKYWELLFLRLLTGISLGGIFPLVFSLLGDLFAPSQRAFVAALVQIAMGVGMSLGQLIAGVVGPPLGWRAPFVVVALPTCALAVLAWYTIPEPKRGITEKALQGDYQAEEDFEYEEKIDWQKTKKLMQIRTNLFVILQGMPGSLPWGMILVFFNDFLAQQKHFSVQAATLVVSIFGIGGGVGIILGGIIGQWLYNKQRKWMPLFTGIIVITSTPPMMWLVNDPLTEKGAVALACVAVFMGGFSASACGPSIRAMIMNVNEPETRGVALALHVVLDDLGKGLGPAAVAVLITGLGRQFAFSLSVAGWIPCGLLILCAYFTLEQDEDDMQARLRRNHERAESERSARTSLRGSVKGSTATLPALADATGDSREVPDGDSLEDAFATRTPDRGSPTGAGGKYRGYGAAGSDDDEDCLDGSPLALSPRRDRSSSGGASGDATPAAGGAAPAADDADADAAAGAADPAPPLHIAGNLKSKGATGFPPQQAAPGNAAAPTQPGHTAGGAAGGGAAEAAAGESLGRWGEPDMQDVSLDDEGGGAPLTGPGSHAEASGRG